MSEELVLKHTEDGVTTLTMNLPRRLNGWTMPMLKAVQAALKRVPSLERLASHADPVRALCGATCAHPSLDRTKYRSLVAAAAGRLERIALGLERLLERQELYAELRNDLVILEQQAWLGGGAISARGREFGRGVELAQEADDLQPRLGDAAA